MTPHEAQIVLDELRLLRVENTAAHETIFTKLDIQNTRVKDLEIWQAIVKSARKRKTASFRDLVGVVGLISLVIAAAVGISRLAGWL